MRVSKTPEQPSQIRQPQRAFSIGFHPFRWMSSGIRALKFLVVLAILTVALWFAVASGLLVVPVLSTIVYERPVPTRVVLVDSNDSSTIAEKLSIGLRGVDLTFSEEELTARLQSEEDAASQVVLLPEGMEYLRAFGPDGRLLLFFQADVDADDGIQFDVTSMKLGAISLPSFLHTSIATSVLAQTFGTEILLASAVKDVELTDGQIRFIIK